ncbi:MAG: hypothetical protein WD077_03470 [Bacteroidia bacterium]
MKTALISSESGKDLKLILEIAKRMGLNFKQLSDEEIEDFGLIEAIRSGKTGETVNTEEFLKELEP